MRHVICLGGLCGMALAASLLGAAETKNAKQPSAANKPASGAPYTLELGSPDMVAFDTPLPVGGILEGGIGFAFVDDGGEAVVCNLFRNRPPFESNAAAFEIQTCRWRHTDYHWQDGWSLSAGGRTKPAPSAETIEPLTLSPLSLAQMRFFAAVSGFGGGHSAGVIGYSGTTVSLWTHYSPPVNRAVQSWDIGQRGEAQVQAELPKGVRPEDVTPLRARLNGEQTHVIVGVQWRTGEGENRQRRERYSLHPVFMKSDRENTPPPIASAGAMRFVGGGEYLLIADSPDAKAELRAKPYDRKPLRGFDCFANVVDTNSVIVGPSGNEGEGDRKRPRYVICDTATGKEKQVCKLPAGSWTPESVSQLGRWIVFRDDADLRRCLVDTTTGRPVLSIAGQREKGTKEFVRFADRSAFNMHETLWAVHIQGRLVGFRLPAREDRPEEK